MNECPCGLSNKGLGSAVIPLGASRDRRYALIAAAAAAAAMRAIRMHCTRRVKLMIIIILIMIITLADLVKLQQWRLALLLHFVYFAASREQHVRSRPISADKHRPEGTRRGASGAPARHLASLGRRADATSLGSHQLAGSGSRASPSELKRAQLS